MIDSKDVAAEGVRSTHTPDPSIAADLKTFGLDFNILSKDTLGSMLFDALNAASPPSQPIASDVVAAPDALSRHGSVEAESHQSPRNAQGWQPIATAPEDGTEILVFKPTVGILVARWLDEDHPDLDGCVGFHEAWNHVVIERITHWMPLPEVPSGAAEVHLDLCASTDDTMPGYPNCDCGAKS